ncbi:MAG: response regulator [Aureliella sp.]
MDGNAPRILVAEDNRVLADVLRFNLQRAGFAVTVALDGNLAIQHLRRDNFDLLITDFQMPGANGEQLCQLVRGELQLDQLPILMCSAKGLELNIDTLKSTYGVSQVIYKPFSMRQIVAFAQTLTASQPSSLRV